MPKCSILFKASADKRLKRLPEKLQKRIVRAVAALANDARPSGCVKIAGEDNVWRIRVGHYRVLYEIQDDRLVILVVRVAHRKDVYRKK